MAVATSRTTLNASTTTKIAENTASRNEPMTVVITGVSANTVYIGTSTVSSTTGIPLTTTSVITVPMYSKGAIYAIASTGTPTITVMTVT